MKRITALFMAVLFCLSIPLSVSATELTDEQIIWYFFKDQGLTEAGIAGLMGNLYAESGLRSNNLQDSFEKKLGYTDNSYVTAVDGGTYSEYSFVHDSAGFGLAQWTYWSRKQGLYDYAEAKGTSVADLNTQLEYLVKELKSSYLSVWNTLLSTTSVRTASNKVLLEFEQPANQSSAVQNERADYGFTYYYKYLGTSRPVTYLIGDVDGNGTIGAADYLTVVSYLSATVELTETQLLAADVNADGNVTSADYMTLASVISGNGTIN